MLNPQLDIGLVVGGHKEYFAKDVVLSTLQSASKDKTLNQLKDRGFKLLVCDESHHARADSYTYVLNALGFGKNINKDRLLLGFTATPFREDRKALGQAFDVIVYQKEIKELISDGYLAKPIAHKIVTNVDLSAIDNNLNGEIKESYLAKLMDTPEMLAIVIKEWITKASGLPTIAFAVNIQHALNMANAFEDAGIKAKAIHSKMPKEKRDEIIAEYKTGKITVITNCGMLTEGFDAPHTACVIIKPSRSRILYRQQLGRALRLSPNKSHAVVLDFNDRNHSICDLDILQSHDVQINEKTKSRSLGSGIPEQLDAKLKDALLVTQDLLSDTFLWTRNKDNKYELKGSSKTKITIIPIANERFKVQFFHNQTEQRLISQGLSFDYAFSCADDFIRKNRNLFTISDLEAPWRKLPISAAQKELLRKKGFRNGLDQLSKGQASRLIDTLIKK
jgi:superfamily II DNA or RNA helicase